MECWWCCVGHKIDAQQSPGEDIISFNSHRSGTTQNIDHGMNLAERKTDTWIKEVLINTLSDPGVFEILFCGPLLIVRNHY